MSFQVTTTLASFALPSQIARASILKCRSDYITPLSTTGQCLRGDLKVKSSLLSSKTPQSPFIVILLMPCSTHGAHPCLSHLFPHTLLSWPRTLIPPHTPLLWLTPLHCLGLALDVTFSRKPSWPPQCALKCTFFPVVILIFICMLLLTRPCLTVQG